MQWCRLYKEFATDPKITSLTPEMRWHYIQLLCLHINDEIKSLTPEQIRNFFGITPKKFQKIFTKFSQNHFIDDRWVLINWEKRQFRSDDSAARQRERYWRNKEKEKQKTSRENSVRIIETSRETHAPDTDTDIYIKHICEVAPSAPTSPLAVKKDVLEIFEFWKQMFGKRKSQLDGKRKRRIEWALKNYTLDEVKEAIQGCKKSPFHNGVNSQGISYIDIELIFRDSTHIEKFIAHYRKDCPKMEI